MANILIIDEDRIEAALEAGVLSGHGHEVRTIPEATDALACIASGWPDLIVLDPNHDLGVPAVHEARGETVAPAPIPLLLITNPHEGASLGGDEYADADLQHPFRSEDLLAAIEQLLTG